ncbi:probable pectate lyase 18 [Malania oleifera]|uniref:probable pectate lyase 18 n=1 Tax=Malania oleifera TaxID=397392 RepID=UPI0025ADEBEC|nr:probable pectate lyase 18 [Malania oleifera]
MTIKLKAELIMNSHKTIDGRGANVHIAGGPCITIQNVKNIIIHGISIHDCKQGGNTMVRDSPAHYGWRGVSDGDAISIFTGSNVWIDHCFFSNCYDGLIDVIRGSTAITISNNHMTRHDKAMLFGASDAYTEDKKMQVTVAFNRFGEGLGQRIPRCRHGYFHILNNDYKQWGQYAIGGSAAPTIYSEGNLFLAPNNRFHKEVTARQNAAESEWRKWNWKSKGDKLVNGADFRNSGNQASAIFNVTTNVGARPVSLVGSITQHVGPLNCRTGSRC